jgi:hypothetical protein
MFFARPLIRSPRVYFQDPQNNMVEMAHDSDSGWNLGSFSVPNAIPQTALAVTTTEDESIHVYYGGSTIVCRRKSIMLTQVGMTAHSLSPASLGAWLLPSAGAPVAG